MFTATDAKCNAVVIIVFVSETFNRVCFAYKVKPAGETVIVKRNIQFLQIHLYFERFVTKLIVIAL